MLVHCTVYSTLYILYNNETKAEVRMPTSEQLPSQETTEAIACRVTIAGGQPPHLLVHSSGTIQEGGVAHTHTHTYTHAQIGAVRPGGVASQWARGWDQRVGQVMWPGSGPGCG